MVEAQHRIATLLLVDNLEEQAVLERMIEGAKPPVRSSRSDLHYLLKTPFRYPPLRHGSRFGTRFEPGLWYGSLEESTVLAEVAYYRFLFLEDTKAPFDHLTTEHSAFRAQLESELTVDLTEPRFQVHRNRLASPRSYAATQALGREMRSAGVEFALFASARDPQHGVNVVVFSAEAFARPVPLGVPRTWTSVATRERVTFSRRDGLEAETHEFPRRFFSRGGKLDRVQGSD